jgi:tetratricopeptide (TPR) repeat protein
MSFPSWAGPLLVLIVPALLVWYVNSRHPAARWGAAVALVAAVGGLYLTKFYIGWAIVAAAVAAFCAYNRMLKKDDAVFERRMIQAAVLAFLSVGFFVITETPDVGPHNASPQAPSSAEAAAPNMSQFKGKTREERLVDMHFARGRQYDSDKQFDLATAEYRKVLSVDPKNADALSDIGVIYMQKGMFQQGAWQLRQALKMVPSHEGAEHNLQTALRIMKTNGLAELPPDTAFVDVPVLMYHKISDLDRKAQMDYLKDKNFDIVTLKDLIYARRTGKKLPARPVVISFDEGFKEQVAKAEAELKNYKKNPVYILRLIEVTGDSPLIRFAAQVTPEMPVPDIGMAGPVVTDPSGQGSQSIFKAGENMHLKFSLRNLGDDMPVTLKIRINAVTAKGTRTVFDDSYGTKRYPIDMQFETVRDVDMMVPLPADLASGQLIFDLLVTSPDGKLEYFRTHDLPLAKISQDNNASSKKK